MTGYALRVTEREAAGSLILSWISRVTISGHPVDSRSLVITVYEWYDQQDVVFTGVSCMRHLE